jgi:hypothetical protein
MSSDEAKMSPTPWYADGYYVMWDGFIIAKCNGEVGPGNTAHIVRCVNSFPALVSALEVARVYICRHTAPTVMEAANKGIVHTIDEALALAKGGET